MIITTLTAVATCITNTSTTTAAAAAADDDNNKANEYNLELREPDTSC